LFIVNIFYFTTIPNYLKTASMKKAVAFAIRSIILYHNFVTMP